VSERQHLEQPARQDLVDHVLVHHGAQRVEHGLPPGRHLLALVAGQEAQLLAADRVEGPEDQHLVVEAALHDGLEAGGEGERRLAGAGAAPERHDADRRVEQQVERDPLFGRTAVQSEGVPVGPDEPQHVVGVDAAQGRRRAPARDDARVNRQGGDLLARHAAVVVEVVDLVGGQLQLHEARPAGVAGLLVLVLLGGQADRGGLDAQRQILGDQHDLTPLGRVVDRHRQDARVVVAQPEPGRQRVGVRVIQLDAHRPVGVVDRDGVVEAPVPHPQVVEEAQHHAGGLPQFGVVSLGLELVHDDERQHHLVLGEVAQGHRVGQQHRGVDDVDPLAGRLWWTVGVGQRRSFASGPGPHGARPHPVVSSGAGRRPTPAR